MKTIFTHPVFLAVLSGALLTMAWPVAGFTPFIFIAFVPLYLLSTKSISKLTFTVLIYTAMLIWNGGTTWWIWNATAEGAIGAILANSLLMTLPWLAFFSLRSYVTNRMANLALIVFWMSFEYLHLQDWGLSWPWLTLGNVFAKHTEWIQWYEYTGSSGGTLWVLVSNLAAFTIICKRSHWKNYFTSSEMHRFLAVMILPLVISKLMFSERTIPYGAANVIIVQPNVDPYREKFAAGTQSEQIAKLIRLTESLTDSATQLVVWPETAIPVQVWEDELTTNHYYAPIWEFIKAHPQISILSGIDSYRKVAENEMNDFSTRNPDGTTLYYKAYNTAALLSADNQFQLYHKSKLVPGVESLPGWLNWMGRLFEQFGGISGTLATDKERRILAQKNGFKIAPAICYESIYGEFLTSYVRNGANIIGVITNDGWWGNTPGYKQHMNYARLRAIETRRWIVRSANTGISCFITPSGKVLQPQGWWKEAAIKMHVPVSNELSFYVRYGDLISKAAVALTFMIILLGIYNKRKATKQTSL